MSNFKQTILQNKHNLIHRFYRTQCKYEIGMQNSKNKTLIQN